MCVHKAPPAPGPSPARAELALALQQACAHPLAQGRSQGGTPRTQSSTTLKGRKQVLEGRAFKWGWFVPPLVPLACRRMWSESPCLSVPIRTMGIVILPPLESSAIRAKHYSGWLVGVFLPPTMGSRS